MVDVFSTMLAAWGASLPVGTDGIDLTAQVKGASTEVRPVAFAESCRPWNIEKKHRGEYRNLYKAQAAIQWPLKLIATPFSDKVELYDLSTDPGELHDLSGERPEDVAELARALEVWRGGELRLGQADADNMERIKALGYIED